jgi:phytoene dehydrogenase-like protein
VVEEYDVAVVGAGLAGLATAARLAKLGHRTVVLERRHTPGGRLRRLEQAGYRWDAVPGAIALPAVLRDLFRSSGRPLERVVTLALAEPSVRHVCGDGTVLDLPTGSRATQLAAIGAALGTRAAHDWTGFVDAQADSWQLLRARVLDPADGFAGLDRLDRATRRLVDGRGGLARLLRRHLDDPRLRAVAAHTCGARPGGRVLPTAAAVHVYLERTFGVWRAVEETTSQALGRALLTRLAERGVTLSFRTTVTAIEPTPGPPYRLATADGTELVARTVVLDVGLRRTARLLGPQLLNPRLLDPYPADDRPARGALRRPFVRVTHLGLDGAAAGLSVGRLLGGVAPASTTHTVLHGAPTIDVWAGPGPVWTIETAGSDDGVDDSQRLDVLDELATRGVDVRAAVVTRLDRSRSDGPPWPGLDRLAAAARAARPAAGVLALGAASILGRGVPFVAWEAARVAEVVGKA